MNTWWELRNKLHIGLEIYAVVSKTENKDSSNNLSKEIEFLSRLINTLVFY